MEDNGEGEERKMKEGKEKRRQGKPWRGMKEGSRTRG